MKIPVLICAAWMAGLAGAQADLTVVQKVEGLGQNTETTAKFKGSKTRVDASPGTSIVIDLRSGEIINLMHNTKTYVKISGATAHAAAESMKPGPGESADPKPTLTATGKKDTISGFTADEYTCIIARAKLSLWLTRELPDYAAVLKEMSGALGSGPMGPLLQSDGIALATLPGFPVRTVLEVPSGQALTRTVVSLSTQPVSDAEFEVPAGYKEMSVPVLTPPAAVAGPSPSPSR